MKHPNLTPKLLAATAAGVLFLSGCFRDEATTSDDASVGTTATVEGRVQGDIGLGKRSAAYAGIEGAAVTVTRIQSDGSIQIVSTAEVKTDIQGHFTVQAAVDGARELIVHAKKEGKEWKAVVSAKAEKGKTVICRPLNVESSIEADVYAKVRGEAKNNEVSFVDIASKIDGELAAKVEAKAEAKTEVEAYLSAQVQAEAKSRIQILLNGGIKATRAQIDKADEARMELQAKLDADLHAALDVSAEVKAKMESDTRKASLRAWADAGITLEAISVARESCFTAMIKGGNEAKVDAEAKLVWLRKIALEHAADVEIAVQENAKTSGGTGIQIDGAATAGISLEASLKIAKTEAGIDSAFVSFRSACAVLQLKVPGHGDSHVGLPGFTLNGKVEGNVAGAEVSVAKVKADGSLEILSGVSAKTDAEGGFTLNADTKLPDSLVVVVTKNDSKLMVFVDSSTGSPLQVGAETTVEAQIVQQIAKDGKTGDVTAADVKAKVDSNVAAQVKGDSAAIAHVIASLEIAAKAQGKLLLISGLEAHDSAVAKARSLELYAQAVAHFTVELSAEARFSLLKSAHAAACKSLRVAAEGETKAAGASEASLKALAEAGASLQASVEASVNAEAIAAAYESYHASVTASLKAALLLHAAACEKADAAIRAKDGARAELMSKLAAAADAEAAAQAQVEFAAKVEAEVKASFTGGLGGPSAAQIKAVSHALVLANMNG